MTDTTIIAAVTDEDPPIYRETHAAIIRRWRHRQWLCPELTSWLVLAGLSELSDGDREVARFQAVNAVNRGWTSGAAA